MSITNFVPEIWSAELEQHLRAQLVYAQDGTINRNYEGNITKYGDTVHITGIGSPSVSDYTKNATDLTYEDLSDSGQTLEITEAKAWSFRVDDLDKRQAMPGFVEDATVSSAYALAEAVDTFVSGLMVAGVAAGTGEDIDGKTLPDNKLGVVTLSSVTDAYDLVVDMRTKLVKANVPRVGWFLIVPPELYALFLRDDRFIRLDTSGSSAGLRNGQVGSISAFTVMESNTVPTTVTDTVTTFHVVGGHSMATTYAEQIVETESLRLEKSFADGVRGLHVYGGKVVYPQALVSATVKIAATVTTNNMDAPGPKRAARKAPAA